MRDTVSQPSESTSRGFGPGGKLTERIRELAGDLMTTSDYQRVADALLEEIWPATANRTTDSSARSAENNTDSML